MGKLSDGALSEPELCFTSLIDIVFLLLIFFMCASRFRQTEQRLDAFLPTDEGQMPVPQNMKKPEELTVFVMDDRERRAQSFGVRANRTARYYMQSRNATPIHNPNDLYPKLKQLADANPDQHVLISLYDERDGRDQQVPFFNIVALLDVCKMAGIKTVKFQAPAIAQ